MRVRRIEAHGFLRYTAEDPLKLELPEVGLVVVTGPNGTGKSSIPEAVAAAFWGRTIRGAPFWRAGERCHVRVEADVAGAEREVTKTEKKSLRLLDPKGAALPEHPTTTKAQQDIERVVGTFEQWRRTSVFSSHDVQSLTHATDAERKRLVEAILGVDVFDAALQQARAELTKATAERDKHLAVMRATENAPGARAYVAPEHDETDREELLASWVAEWRGLRETDLAKEYVRAMKDRTRSLAAREAETSATFSKVSAETMVALERHNRLMVGTCPECAQPIPKALKMALASGVVEANARLAEAELARACAANAGTAARIRHNTAEAKVWHLEDKIREARSRMARAHDAIVAAERQEAAVAAAQAAAAKAAARHEEAKREAAAASSLVSRLAAFVEVFSTKGARALMLGDIVRSIGARAGALVSTLMPGARVSAAMGEAGDFSIGVQGVGGGFGYDAGSSGERRRIDIPLMLALAETADLGAGTVPGTLFFDEALDALDAAGVFAVTEMVLEVSTRRPVVLITHNLDLAAALRPRAAQVIDLGAR